MRHTSIKTTIHAGMALLVLAAAYTHLGDPPTAVTGLAFSTAAALILLPSGIRDIERGHVAGGNRVHRSRSPVAFWTLVILTDFVAGLSAVAVAVAFALRL